MHSHDLVVRVFMGGAGCLSSSDPSARLPPYAIKKSTLVTPLSIL